MFGSGKQLGVRILVGAAYEYGVPIYLIARNSSIGMNVAAFLWKVSQLILDPSIDIDRDGCDRLLCS